MTQRIAPLLVFLLSVVVTLVFQALLPPQFYDVGSTDFSTRDLPTAQAILNRQPFFQPDMVFAVGYPIIISGILRASQVFSFPLEDGLRALAIVEMGLSTALVFLLTRVIGSSRRAWVAAFLCLTYPFALWLTGQNGTELSFMVFFLASLWLFWYAAVTRPGAHLLWIVAGMLIGMSILIRPMAVGLPFVMIATLLMLKPDRVQSRPLVTIALFLVGSLLVVMPWEMVVFKNTGRWVLINDQGPSSVRDGLTFAAELKDYRHGLDVPGDVMELMQDALANQAALDSPGQISSFVWKYVQTQPITVFKLLLLKAARSWYGTDSQRYEEITGLVQLTYLLLGLAGAFLLVRRGGMGRAFVLGMFLIIGYFWVITVLVLPILRYMIPAMALIMILLSGLIFPRPDVA